ncbi:hypothetical protein [Sphingomonas sp. 2378]|uniref:hypothetical protein n=1 Tax=Sphingomonas sp. 2378 TaxID=1219748 RepID=UPI00311B41EA
MAQGHDAIPNLLGMARTAVEAGNNEEAISYFNRVLEIDPTVSEAWLGKGNAVAQQSSLDNVRMREVAVSFGHAIATSPEEDRPLTARFAIAELTNIGLKTLIRLQEHVVQFAAVQGMAERRATVSLAILDAMEVGLRWVPDFEQGLKLMVSAGKEALSAGLTPTMAAEVQGKIAAARAKLRVINPEEAAAEDAAEADAAKLEQIRAEAAAHQRQVDSWAAYVAFGIAGMAFLLWLFTR